MGGSIAHELPAVGQASDDAVGAQLFEGGDNIALATPEAVTQLDRGQRARGILELVSDLHEEGIGFGGCWWG